VKSKSIMAVEWDDKDEDELTEAIEAAEGDGDLVMIIGILSHSANLGDGAAVAEAACDALLRATSSVVKSAEAGALGAGEVILKVMSVFMEEAAIVEVCLGCLKNIGRDTEACARLHAVARGEGGGGSCAALVVKAMNDHAENDEPTLQEQACLAIEALAATHTELAAAFVAAGAPAALEAAKTFITNERNKTYPEKALAKLTEYGDRLGV